ncbi:MAG: hypothetical protein JWN45_1620 [Acidobacteriaceae bacterium]|nr:hypothetical protein [Acidobacteriaceae bacterium]
MGHPAISGTIVGVGVVAVFGAFVSAWKVVTKQLEPGHRVKVKGSQFGGDSILVTALNVGKQPVTLVAGGLRLPEHKTTHHFEPSGTAKFPVDLQRGKSCYMVLPKRAVAEALKRGGLSGTIDVNGYYCDSFDKRHFSEVFKVDVEVWLKT